MCSMNARCCGIVEAWRRTPVVCSGFFFISVNTPSVGFLPRQFRLEPPTEKWDEKKCTTLSMYSPASLACPVNNYKTAIRPNTRITAIFLLAKRVTDKAIIYKGSCSGSLAQIRFQTHIAVKNKVDRCLPAT